MENTWLQLAQKMSKLSGFPRDCCDHNKISEYHLSTITAFAIPYIKYVIFLNSQIIVPIISQTDQTIRQWPVSSCMSNPCASVKRNTHTFAFSNILCTQCKRKKNLMGSAITLHLSECHHIPLITDRTHRSEYCGLL
jgi:hypothetical protein